MTDHTEGDDGSRAEAFVNSSIFRAEAVAYINSLNEFTSSSTICTALSGRIAELGMDEHKAQIQLRKLAEIGIIDHKQQGKNFYYAGKGVDPEILKGKTGTFWKRQVKQEMDENQSVLAVEQTGPTMEKPGKKAVVRELPAVTLDVVKATGRVRLTINGIIIDIGVVDK